MAVIFIFMSGRGSDIQSAHNWNSISIWLRVNNLFEVRKRARIRNRYNQAPHLTPNTSGKVTTRVKRSALSQQVTTRHQQTDVLENITKQDRNNVNDP